jgi:hypothetical protein
VKYIFACAADWDRASATLRVNPENDQRKFAPGLLSWHRDAAPLRRGWRLEKTPEGMGMAEPIFIHNREIPGLGVHRRRRLLGRRRENARWTLTPESFETFLSWLSPDRDVAGRKYEQIRNKLVSFFSWRGCHIPEELFDRTVDRVCGKIGLGAAECSGDALSFCYAVARFVLQEYWREVKLVPMPDDLPFLKGNDPERKEQELQFLESCLDRLSAGDRDLITAYYQGEGRERIRIRKQLATEAGGANALRIQVFRIRARLRKFLSDRAQDQSIGRKK